MNERMVSSIMRAGMIMIKGKLESLLMAKMVAPVAQIKRSGACGIREYRIIKLLNVDRLCIKI